MLYGAFSGFENWHSSGLVETFAAPLMFLIAVQMTAVSLVTEKTQRLRESMRMMGMRELPYWASYVVSFSNAYTYILRTITDLTWLLVR